MADGERFNYTYCANEQEEIKEIRKKYISDEKKDEDKLEQLRRLDAGVYSKASKYSIIIGAIGALVLGIGMSLVMTDFGSILGTLTSMIVGIVVGVVGIILVSLAYPLYNRILKKEREKLAPEIIRLTDELMK